MKKIFLILFMFICLHKFVWCDSGTPPVINVQNGLSVMDVLTFPVRLPFNVVGSVFKFIGAALGNIFYGVSRIPVTGFKGVGLLLSSIFRAFEAFGENIIMSGASNGGNRRF